MDALGCVRARTEWRPHRHKRKIFTMVHAKQIVELANQNRLPAIYAFRFILLRAAA